MSQHRLSATFMVYERFTICTLYAQCITPTFFTDCLFAFVYRCWYYSSSYFFLSPSLSFSLCIYMDVSLCQAFTVHWLLLNGMAWKELNSSMTCKSASPQNLPTIVNVISLFSFLPLLCFACLFFIVAPPLCHTHEIFYNLIKSIIYFCLFKFKFSLSIAFSKGCLKYACLIFNTEWYNFRRILPWTNWNFESTIHFMTQWGVVHTNLISYYE